MLKINLPSEIPRASTSVDSAADLIERLIDRGHAYWHQGEVFYDPLTYEGFGRIFGLDMSQWPKKKVRFKKDTYPGQQWNLGDFILWHKRKEEDKDVWWDTGIGQGRPAWNIQDAAMIGKHMGFEIDIHTGGMDNLYRHHDYTMAVMEGASGKEFCPWWLHGGYLLVEGEKMSKSKGNVTYVNDLIDDGFYPRHIRFYLLYGRYRENLDLRIENMEDRAGYLDRIRNLATLMLKRKKRDTKDSDGVVEFETDPAAEMRAAFEERMNDNLDYAGAFDTVAKHLFRAVQMDGADCISDKGRERLRAVLADIDRVFGVLGCG